MNKKTTANCNFSFSHTFNIGKPNFYSIDGGKDDVNKVSVKIYLIEKGFLQFAVKFEKYPQNYPFCAVLDIQIQDQNELFFYILKDKSQKGTRKFTSHFKKDLILQQGATITYNFEQVHAYTCTLMNPGCLCYLNSAIQLLFHLSKFRHHVNNVALKNKSTKSGFFLKMKNLFDEMLKGYDNISPIELTESFGWPPSACNVQHDASEFLICLLTNYRNSIPKVDELNKKRFDSLFVSDLNVNYIKANQIEEEKQLILFLESENEKISSQINTFFNNDETIKKIKKLPEIMIIQADLPYYKIEEHLDFKDYLADENMISSKYTLSGLILRVGDKYDSGHYKCIVRANSNGVWYYFNDQIYGFYTTLNEGEKIISNLAKGDRARILVYIADNVINDHFQPENYIIPNCVKSTKVAHSLNLTRYKFYIIADSDITDYVNKKNRTDFDKIQSKIYLLETEITKSDLYSKVAKEFKVTPDSFVLRLSEANGAPSCYIIQNNNDIIPMDRADYYIYYEPKTQKQNNYIDNVASVPLYFLQFKFDPNKFILNVEYNLSNSYRCGSKNNSIAVRSEPVQTSRLKLDNNDNDDYDYDYNSDDETTNREKNLDNIVDRNTFSYLKAITLDPNTDLNSILPQILEALKKPEGTKISFYIANDDEITATQIKEIDPSQPINKNFQISSGKFIFVQAIEDDENAKKGDQLDQIVEVKLLFFKYLKEALGRNDIYSKSLSNVFVIQNFSIPITLVSLTDSSKRKTLLYPIYFPLTLKELYKLICAAMGETFDDQTFFQLFLSFNKDSPPFTERVTNMRYLNRVLSYSLFNEKIKMNQIHFNTTSENFVYENDTDLDVEANIYFYYNIHQNKQKNEISLRTYYSNDSINTNFISQVIIPNEERISYLVKNMDKIFPIEKLPNEEREQLERAKESNEEFDKSYLILKISNCKVSDIVNFEYMPSSNLAIRFDKRQPESYQDNFLGYIPVYYGARYNKTKFIASFGVPFLLPITKEDLQINSEKKFTKSSIYKKLTEKIPKHVTFGLYVTDYNGMEIKMDLWNFNELLITPKTIEKEIKYYIAICYKVVNKKEANAASFLDEENFFKGSIKILC